MNYKVVSTAMIAVVLSVGLVSAKSLRQADEPAEFPPASYQGTQYVDSRGCVYVRAGSGDGVHWVPRVSRDREVICGFKPTRTGESTPVVRGPSRGVERITVDTSASSSRPQRVSPRPLPSDVSGARTAVAPAARQAAPAPTAVWQGQNAPSVGNCVSSAEVRCGPQAALPYDAGSSSGAAVVHPGRTAPRHVYAQQQNTLRNVPVPEGYRRVWEDDRLNPHRAHQSAEGQARMKLIWTDTVPRRLINAATGESVTERYPHLTAPRAAPAGTSGGRYVQVATFGVEANARNTAVRFQNAGLPVRIGNLRQGGRALRTVMIGPINDPTRLRAALQTARRAGFSDAYLR